MAKAWPCGNCARIHGVAFENYGFKTPCYKCGKQATRRVLEAKKEWGSWPWRKGSGGTKPERPNRWAAGPPSLWRGSQLQGKAPPTRPGAAPVGDANI
eukprot:5968015-Pyramimonas_sp.AAC.1